MIHARNEYQHIQDPSGQIDRNMPVLLILGQDSLFVDMVHSYRAKLVKQPMHDVRLIEALDHQIERGLLWKSKYGSKLPDTPDTFVAPKTESDLLYMLREKYPTYVLHQDRVGFCIKVGHTAQGQPHMLWEAVTGIYALWQDAAEAALESGSPTSKKEAL